MCVSTDRLDRCAPLLPSRANYSHHTHRRHSDKYDLCTPCKLASAEPIRGPDQLNVPKRQVCDGLFQMRRVEASEVTVLPPLHRRLHRHCPRPDNRSRRRGRLRSRPRRYQRGDAIRDRRKRFGRPDRNRCFAPCWLLLRQGSPIARTRRTLLPETISMGRDTCKRQFSDTTNRFASTVSWPSPTTTGAEHTRACDVISRPLRTWTRLFVSTLILLEWSTTDATPTLAWVGMRRHPADNHF
jgi:hypothetical protein